MLRIPPLLLASIAVQLAAQTPALHRLTSTPGTVVFGYYDAATPPVLRIQPGDRVKLTTSMIASPRMLEEAGLPPDQIKPSLRDIHSQVTDRGPGPHILTGPIYIETAEPGDVLEVRIESIQLALPYSLNLFIPGKGVLPDDYPYKRVKIIPLDEQRMVADFAEGIEIPLRPFFGSMGVAPPKELGRISSAPPWVQDFLFGRPGAYTIADYRLRCNGFRTAARFGTPFAAAPAFACWPIMAFQRSQRAL